MFYEQLKQICDQRGTSPSSVLGKIGMSKANITFWKSGQLPTLETIFRLAAQLEVSPKELIPEITPKI